MMVPAYLVTPEREHAYNRRGMRDWDIFKQAFSYLHGIGEKVKARTLTEAEYTYLMETPYRTMKRDFLRQVVGAAQAAVAVDERKQWMLDNIAL